MSHGRGKFVTQPGFAPTRLELVRLALSLKDEMDYELMTEAAERFAATNPQAGVVASRRLKDEQRRRAYLEALFRRWGIRDGRSAAEYLVTTKAAELGGEEPRSGMMLATASGWSETDPGAAAAWLDEHRGAGKVN